MLQKEFEERIGRSVSEEEYVEANAMYELAGDAVDKDTFCREWMEIGDSALVKGLFATAYNSRQEAQELKLMHKECQEIISDAADAMLEVADGLLGRETAERETPYIEGGKAETGAPSTLTREVFAAGMLTRKAWWLVGQKEVTKRKVAKGYQLDESDRETIINHLK